MSFARWPALTRRPQRSAFRKRLRFDPLEERTVPTAEIEPNNTIATATAFTTPTDTLTGSISSATDIDFFKANLVSGDVLTVLIDPRDTNDLALGPALEVLNPQGQIVGTSLDGRITTIVAPAAGTYYLRFFAGQIFGNFTGSYSISTSVTAFNGVSESEPNDLPLDADAVGAFANFRGALGSATDADFFSFSGTAGRAVAIKLGNRPAANPAIRLLDPNGNLVASNLAGNGLHAVLPVTGTYRFALQSDNTAGIVTGSYVGSVNVATTSIIDAEPGNSFVGAAAWTVNDTTSRVVGTLSSLTDVDAFAVTLSSPGAYNFQPESPTLGISTQGRSVKIYSELGQLIRYSVNNGKAWSGAGTSAPGGVIHRFFVTIQATNEIGLGAYSLSGRLTQAFPTQRDVPLFFHDYTGQTTHLNKGPAAPFDPAAVPQAIGMFEARYDIYDVDVTLTKPATGIEYAGVGVGEFSDHGGGGLGSGSWGTRRVSGDSLVDTSQGAGTGVRQFGTPVIINHELGHVSTLPHSRQPLNFMAYERQYGISPVGSAFQFPWTDQRVPTEFSLNQRDHLDWVLQAGRIALEAEPNNALASPQNLDPFMNEMTADSAPRNDRVVVVGRIDTATDVDVYRITAAANETFAFDIDSAEFQYPLNASLSIFDAGGNLVATNAEAIDRDSGLFSVDPYITHQFTAAGAYTIRVVSQRGTTGDYRLKVTADQAFDSTGPRVLATWPNGGGTQTSTRQILVYLNDQVDPATLTASNVVVTGASTGVRAGVATFDPLDATLIWLADTPLPADNYTVTLKSGASGIKDFRGNQLDGETDGSFAWPERSGNGTAGGDFSFSFAITGPDTSAATVVDSSYAEHASNRGRFTLDFNDTLDIQSLYTAGMRVRAPGPDGNFDTSDDVLLPTDVLYNKLTNAGPTSFTYVYTRGIPEAGNYRVDGSFLDADGNTVTVSEQVTVPASALAHGPIVADVSIQPNTTVSSSITDIEVIFGGAVNAATLTASTFVLRYSPDSTFYNGNDTVVADSDGSIAWDAARRKATFRAASALASGYYLLELSGGPGGIASPGGQLLDGEYLDSSIPGNSLFSLWSDSPTGDGAPGGDFKAAFNVHLGNSAPVALAQSPAMAPILEDATNPSGQQPAVFLAASVTDADLGDPKAMAVIGVNDAVGGVWQYSLDAGASWLPITAVTLSSALLISGTDRVRFVPTADVNGTATITYHAWDQSTGFTGSRVDLNSANSRGGSTAFSTANQTATLAILPVNDVPSFTKGADQTVAEDSGLKTLTNWATNISAGPASESGQSVTFEISTNNDALFAQLPAISPTGTLTFRPAANAHGSATVTVRLKDDGGTANGGQDTSPAQTFNITVTPVNDAPLPGGTSPSLNPVLEDATNPPGQSPAAFLGGHVTDLDGDPLGIAVVGLTNAEGGTWQYSLDGTNWSNFGAVSLAAARLIGSDDFVRFLPAVDANGTATITYHLWDHTTGTAGSTVDLTPPSSRGGTTAFSAGSQTATLAITPVNDAPSFTKGPDVTILEDSGAASFSNWATNLSKGPANENGQTLSFEVTANSNPALFSAGPAVSATGALTFTPSANANGSATITLRIKDNGGTANGGVDTSPTQTFTINVTPVNDTPSFTKGPNQRLMLANPGPQSVPNWARDISPGPADETGQSVIFEIAGNTDPSLFSVLPAVSPSGTLTYTPAADVHGYATITLRLKDNGGTATGGQDISPTQSFWIGINPINQAPTFTVGANQSRLEDSGPQTVAGWALGISPGSPFELDQNLNFEIVSNSNPALFVDPPAVSPEGTLTFQSAPHANGIATVELRLRDDGGTAFGGQDTSAIQSFTINVTPVNDAPSFTSGGNRAAGEDSGAQAFAGWASGISAGPPDEAGQLVSFEVVEITNPDLFAGAPAVSADGTLTFTPAADAFGSAEVAIRARDDGGTANGGFDASGGHVITITILPVNDPPSFAVGADPSSLEDGGSQTVPGWATAMVPGPSNEAGQSMTFEVTGNTNPGLFAAEPAVAPDGTLTYTPAANAFGTATVTLRLKDDGGTADGGQDTSAEQSFTITLRPVNDAPSFTKGPDPIVDEDSGLVTMPGWATNLLAGPANEAGQALSFEFLGNSNPTLFASSPTLMADGTLSFTPAANGYGTSTVTLRIVDDGGTAEGGSNFGQPVTFTFTVRPVNDAPVAAPDAVTAIVGRPLTINVLGNDSDIDADPLQVLSFTAPANGSVRRQGNNLLYTTRLTVAGTDTFTYVATDSHGGLATGTVNVTVVDTVAPTIRAVRLYYGPNAYADFGSLSRAILPWSSVRKIAVVFSEGVTVTEDALSVIGIGGAYGTTFTYDAATRTATWTLAQPVSNDRVTVLLGRGGVSDASGNALGTDWARTVGILAGDYDGNGVVTDADLRAIKLKSGRIDRFADIDGNGVVNSADHALAAANKGRRLR